MTKYELVKDYIEGCIRDMEDNVDWARDRMQDEEKTFRYHWALDTIDNEDNKAFGTLQYVKIWEREIDDEQFKELTDMLHNAWSKARNRAAEEIMMARN